MCTETSSDDEQIARDIQLAMELENEERELAKHRFRSSPRGTNRIDRNRSSDARRKRKTEQGLCSASTMNRNANHMLFVPCEVDGHLQTLFVDSGASSSAMSSTMMRQLGLEHKLNKRFGGGQANGVGSANMLGVLENVEITIGHVEFRLFFMVLEAPKPYLILGLDQMRRFKCLIDLSSNTLTFGGPDGVSVEFLSADVAAAAAAQTFMADDAGDANVELRAVPREPRRRKFLGIL